MAKILLMYQKLAPQTNEVISHLHDYTLETVKQVLVQGVQSEGDWSLKTNMICNCQDCREAKGFLVSKNENIKIWAIVQVRRVHLQRVFEELGIPVKLVVKKEGSPHKLIMNKTSALHKKSKEHFSLLKKYHNQIAA